MVSRLTEQAHTGRWQLRRPGLVMAGGGPCAMVWSKVVGGAAPGARHTPIGRWQVPGLYIWQAAGLARWCGVRLEYPGGLAFVIAFCSCSKL